MKVKFIVDRVGEDMTHGDTTDHNYFYGNINKVPELWQLIKAELDKLPPNSSLDNAVPMYNFIGCILVNNHNKNVRMLLFDAKNNEEDAKNFADKISNNNREKYDGIMNVFNQIRSRYDQVKDIAELSFPSQ
jgi:hypothetical protein